MFSNPFTLQNYNKNSTSEIHICEEMNPEAELYLRRCGSIAKE